MTMSCSLEWRPHGSGFVRSAELKTRWGLGARPGRRTSAGSHASWTSRQAAGPRMALAVLRSLATTSRLACLARRFSSTVLPVFCDRLALATATPSLVARADALCPTPHHPHLGSDARRGCADPDPPPHRGSTPPT